MTVVEDVMRYVYHDIKIFSLMYWWNDTSNEIDVETSLNITTDTSIIASSSNKFIRSLFSLSRLSVFQYIRLSDGSLLCILFASPMIKSVLFIKCYLIADRLINIFHEIVMQYSV